MIRSMTPAHMRIAATAQLLHVRAVRTFLALASKLRPMLHADRVLSHWQRVLHSACIRSAVHFPLFLPAAAATTAACRLADAGLHFLGAVPEDKLLRAVRLDEVQIAMEAELKFGSGVQLDQVRMLLAHL